MQKIKIPRGLEPTAWQATCGNNYQET